jgi:hypothetical protein
MSARVSGSCIMYDLRFPTYPTDLVKLYMEAHTTIRIPCPGERPVCAVHSHTPTHTPTHTHTHTPTHTHSNELHPIRLSGTNIKGKLVCATVSKPTGNMCGGVVGHWHASLVNKTVLWPVAFQKRPSL